MVRIPVLVSALVGLLGIACSTANADDKSDCANYKNAADAALVACNHPRHALAMMRRADSYEKIGELEKALADYQAAQAIYPTLTDFKAAIGRVQQKLAARPGSAAPPSPPQRITETHPAPATVNDTGRRFALVVGNDRYANLSADQQLGNAINDARAVKTTLEGLRFEVLYGENLDRRALVDRLFDLAARLGKDDIAFFYFAGHGVSFSGTNYLLPSDIPIPHAAGRAEEARLADQAIAETQVIERIVGAGARVAIVVLDACRDNPLRGADTRSIGGARGLSLGQPAQGVFSIYSAGVGQEALDRLGPDDHNPNSVFTRVFIEKLKTPGLDLKAVATETRRAVVELAQKIGQNQFPAYYDQISSEVYLAGQPPR